jgi:hypothetical protein
MSITVLDLSSTGHPSQLWSTNTDVFRQHLAGPLA